MRAKTLKFTPIPAPVRPVTEDHSATVCLIQTQRVNEDAFVHPPLRITFSTELMKNQGAPSRSLLPAPRSLASKLQKPP